MRHVLIVCVFLSFCLKHAESEEAEDYYERLITQNIQSAKEFVLPVDNGEFFEGVNYSQVFDYGSYDFIIVGAGSAGSVLATRLSEVQKWNILLLEAGGEEDDFSDIPAMLAYLEFSKKNWGYYTTPQKSCCQGMINKQCNFPRGKSIGGSSTINSLMYVRGNAEDFDEWERQGNPGWSYKDVLPYFKKSEHSLIEGDEDFHGTDGYWTASYKIPLPDLFPVISQGLSSFRIPYIDYNGKNQIGYSRVQYSIKDGKRQSTGRAFLEKIRYNRHNIEVVTNALVTKIVINPKTKVAKGVEFVSHGKSFKAHAEKDVVVSAGSINSAQLLMVSGIGPKEDLQELGIQTIQSLPVGKNLQDHPVFYLLHFRTNTQVTNNDFRDQIKDYIKGIGPFTDCGNNAIVGFLNTTDPSSKYPDMEYIFVVPNTTVDIMQRFLNLDSDLESYFNSINPMTDFRVLLILMHPKSLGTVSLKSKSVKDFPNIDINYFSDPHQEDIETFYRGIQFVLKLMENEYFRGINAELVPLQICKEFETYSKEYWYCVIKHGTATLYHPTGTTRMGPKPSTSVVNYEMKVHGVKNLRVADAGVIPYITTGHTNAPSIMIGEKTADIIKKEYLDSGAGYMHNIYTMIVGLLIAILAHACLYK